MFYYIVIYHTNVFIMLRNWELYSCSGDRSERYWIYSAHLRSIIKHGVALPNPAVVTVRSAAGFERPTPIDVVKVQVCVGDGHPTLPSGMLELCAEPLRTVSIN